MKFEGLHDRMKIQSPSRVLSIPLRLQRSHAAAHLLCNTPARCTPATDPTGVFALNRQGGDVRDGSALPEEKSSGTPGLCRSGNAPRIIRSLRG